MRERLENVRGLNDRGEQHNCDSHNVASFKTHLMSYLNTNKQKHCMAKSSSVEGCVVIVLPHFEYIYIFMCFRGFGFSFCVC